MTPPAVEPVDDIRGAALDDSTPAADHRRGGHPVAAFLARRAATGVLAIILATLLIFVGTSVIPGSPSEAVLGRAANPKVASRIDHRLGYDKPVVEQYMSWVVGAAHGDFGNSAVGMAAGNASAPIWPMIRSPLENTATLAGLTTALLIPLSLFLGVVAALYAGKGLDNAISGSTLVLMALPEFVVGAILIAIFATALRWLPPVSLVPPGASPLANPIVLVMPVLTLLAVSVAWTVRLVRVGVIEVLKTDYVQMARLHGIRERKVLHRYVLRNALAPSIQIFALSIQYLFGGVIVTEAVFNYPGIGTELLNAINLHDNTEIQAIAVILAALYIGINIVADLTVMMLVPKLRAPQT